MTGKIALKVPFHCSNCYKILSGREWDIKESVSQSKRDFYFCPVGTHFNFGMHNNSRTPKVIIMGVSTSGPAREQFERDFSKVVKIEDSIKYAALKNTFSGTLKHRLVAIINLSGLLKLIPGNIEYIPKDFFGNYIETDKKYRTIFAECYLSQAILCASLDKERKSDIPKKNEIDDRHIRCIRAQNEILKSLNGKASLVILLGNSESGVTAKYCFKKAGCFSTIENICTSIDQIVEIYHPSPKTREWNFLSRATDEEKYGNKAVSDGDIIKWAKDTAEISSDERYRKRVLNGAQQLLLRKKVDDIFKKSIE